MRCETAEDALAIRCVQAMCPHLGCGIDFVPDRRVFTCPCHASEFDAAGQRRFGPSPRDMDELECRVSPPDERGERWIEVKYVEFRTGIPQKRSAT
jgi:Rieske Fe-S protein